MTVNWESLRSSLSQIYTALGSGTVTRERTLTEEAKARLEWVGTKEFARTRSRGTIATVTIAASIGAWCKPEAQVRSIQSREEWTLWISAHTYALTRSQASPLFTRAHQRQTEQSNWTPHASAQAGLLSGRHCSGLLAQL